MAYAKHTWVDNEDITTARLNNLEDGIANAGDGYDAVISIYHDNISDHDYEITVKKGTYEALRTKFLNKQPPVILAEVWDELAQYRGSTTMISIYTFPSASMQTNDIIFITKMPNTNGSVHTNWWGLSLCWNQLDEVYVW